jgi:hypothetical protein
MINQIVALLMARPLTGPAPASGHTCRDTRRGAQHHSRIGGQAGAGDGNNGRDNGSQSAGPLGELRPEQRQEGDRHGERDDAGIGQRSKE